MKIFYHVTIEENINNIFRIGLIPKIGKRAQIFGEDFPCIYLFNTIEDTENAITNWLGDSFEDTDILWILKITLPEEFKIEEMAFEHHSLEKIKPEYIELLKLA